MGILFHCPECERPLNVGEKLAGQPGLCPNCRKSIKVPAESEIMKAEFRTRLNAWTRKQQLDQMDSGTIEISPSEIVKASAGPVSAPPKSIDKKSSGPAPVVTLKPIDVGGVPELASESKLVGDGLSAKFSSGAPDMLNDSGPAVWFVRPPSGGQFGPASANLLRQWIEEGRVSGDSYVWCEGWDNWQIAGDVFPAVARKVSPESITPGNSDQVTATRTRTAYMKARKRRTMRNVIGLVAGTAVVIILIVVLLVVVGNRAA